MEHRWGTRKATDVAVRFISLPGTIGRGRVTNISLTGAFMETKAKLRLRSVLYVETREQDHIAHQRRRLAASVIRRTSAGVGLEWCEPTSTSPVYERLCAGVVRPPEPQRAPQLSMLAAEFATASSEDTYSYQFDFVDDSVVTTT